MTDAVRPRRSILYMPGSNARAMEKARSLPADGLILDLEDAVAPEAKASAREQVISALKQGGFGQRELIVRVNAQGTEWWRDDLAALATARVEPDAILFPKIDSPEHLLVAIDALDSAGCVDSIPVWIMAETPRCILQIYAIASAHPRLAGIVLGTSDLAKDTRVRHTPDRLGFIAALNLCVYAARANGLVVIDGVHLDLEDDAGLAAACLQGRDLGFDGKSLIHPRQIEAANTAFAPDAAELASARQIIDAHEAASAAGQGVVVVNGRLVEALHVEEARRTLALAAAIAALGEDQ
ncbi:HpcH/HpaI aldolase/citrate lyase family protein [Haliea sp. E17]|uniref:HpcH/HpaI aldolase/citrate lyase family protein n=1 Tax=Haliea sp. E17 TaxID=3401576 RepID=UPI003AB0D27C